MDLSSSSRSPDEHYRVNKQAVVILVAGAISGLVLMLWPFFPALLGFAPVAIVLALIAWFLVVSRLRMAGPREFLDTVAEHAETPTPDRSSSGRAEARSPPPSIEPN